MNPESRAALRELVAAYENPHLISKDLLLRDLPVFGCLTPHVPLELLYAARIIPVRVQGGKSAGLAPAHLQSYTCGPARAAIHGLLGGEYDYLNGLIAAKTCDVGLSLFQICQEVRPGGFAWLVSLPGNCDEEGIQYLAEEFGHLKSALEDFRDKEIPRKSLLDAISLYNDLRNAVETLWRRRDEGSLAISGGDLARALKGAQVLPPDRAVDLMNAILSDEVPPPHVPRNGIRLLMIGNSYAVAGLIDMIEKYGADVVFEDTTSLGRYFGDTVRLDSNPIRALAEHYASSVTGCYRLSYAMRMKHIKDILQTWKIGACINVVQKFCDTSLFEAPLLKESFRTSRIPYLYLEIDDTSPGLSQIETRVQAFFEMVGGIQ